MSLSRPSPHQTRAEDRVSLREKIGLGLGRVAADGSGGTIHVLLSPIYNMTLGMNPALISTVVFIQRIWDAVTDPVCGQYSDNFRSRWGRRRPLLAVAALPTALFFAGLWWTPPGLGDAGLFWFLLGMFVVFHLAHTLYAMPLTGLVLEATDDYHERTRIAAVLMVFGYAFQVLSQWIFPLTQLAIFSDPMTGLRWVTGGCAVVFFIAGLAPVFLCRERNYARLASLQPKINMREGLRNVLANPPFMRLIVARVVASFGYNIVGMLGIYMNTYYVFGGDVKAGGWFYGYLGTAYMAAAITCSVFVYPRLSRRIGKRRTLQLAALVLMAGCVSKLFIYHPGAPWLQLVVLITNGAAGSGIGLMATAMMGDIADYEEWRNGRRNEAFLASIMSWFDKVGGSLGSLLGGFVLLWIGFDAKLGPQTEHTLRLMKFSYFAMPFFGALVALLLMQRYELGEDKVYEIKAELARRHAAAAPAAT
ncbi:MAG: MFS transporter [Verrucomicrobiota bacterium]